MTPKHICIVDDEPAIIEPLAYALQTEGFTVTTLELGQPLLALLSEETPSLIVMDVGLPDINGFELFRAVRQKTDVPVLFLTARGDEIDRIVGLELGADDYVVKPFSPREVTARIRSILKRWQASLATKESASTSSALIIDRDRARAEYFQETLTLTRYEYLLLAYLAEHPQRVFSRTQLLDAIWPQSSGSMERSVDTHIKTLRAKLKTVRDDVELIQTHRGLGYSLEPVTL
jgi:two-component system catabolic regulation response regulator CreB